MLFFSVSSRIVSPEKTRLLVHLRTTRKDSEMFINAELDHRINYELKMLEHARKEYASRLEFLADCRGSFLRRTRPGKSKRHYYYIKKTGS